MTYKINIGKEKRKFNNKILYSVIILGILIIFVASIYALGAVPSIGHAISELQTCGANQILKMNSAGTAWNCGSDNIASCPACPTCPQGTAMYAITSRGCRYESSYTNLKWMSDSTSISVLTPKSTCTTISTYCSSGYYPDCEGKNCKKNLPRTCSNTYVGRLIS